MFTEKPEVVFNDDGSRIWEKSFNHFIAKIYVPKTDLPEFVINFGFSAPYLLYFDDAKNPKSNAEIVSFANRTGLSEIAARYGTSVVFITPKGQQENEIKGELCGWENATDDLFLELIANSKIHQYYENGYVILNNRFTKKCDGYAIRGAIFKTILIGKNAAADYIATHLLKKITGEGLWGPADVAPTVCILENLSVKPQLKRNDMPVVSVNNNDEINSILKTQTKYFYRYERNLSDCKNENPEKKDVCKTDSLKINTEENDFVDYSEIYGKFAWKFKRWGWDGDIQFEPDFSSLGMIEKPDYMGSMVSSDNRGDDSSMEYHNIGWIAYYNENLFDDYAKGTVPLLLCFHGGGDSAKHIAQVSQWYKVAHEHNFLLVCVENHINSTATEMEGFIQMLRMIYDRIDSHRIYATGFSMGGCKTWDFYQEFPEVFAGLAPMDATFEVGLNVYGEPSKSEINKNVLVPIFYVGGEESPLPELPFQAEKCLDRMRYVFEVNQIATKYDVKFDAKEDWENKIWGISGDKVEIVHDDSRNSDLTMNYFKSTDGKYYTVFASVSGQEHECRYHSCEFAWRFISRFKRDDNGRIVEI